MLYSPGVVRVLEGYVATVKDLAKDDPDVYGGVQRASRILDAVRHSRTLSTDDKALVMDYLEGNFVEGYPQYRAVVDDMSDYVDIYNVVALD